MTRISLILLLCFFGACAGPRPWPRAPLVPMHDLPAVPPPPPREGQAGAPNVAPKVAPMDGPRRPLVVESVRSEGSPSPVYRTVVEVIEVPVEVPVDSLPRAGVETDQYDDYLRGRASYQPRRRSQFPINTLVGAGVGAIIGNQNGRSEQGALIGSGVGLLLDLSRW